MPMRRNLTRCRCNGCERNSETYRTFSSPSGTDIELPPSDYYVTVLPEGSFLLVSSAEKRRWIITAKRAWHEFNLKSPLTLSVPAEHGENVMVLLPGGGALVAGGSHKASVEAQKLAFPSTPIILQSIHERLHVWRHCPPTSLTRSSC